MFYRIFRTLAGTALRLFFRRVEVEGLAETPATGLVLLVSNHTNALVDPLVPLIVLRRRVTLTAKNTLSANPLLGLLAKGLGAVPFHRAADVGKGADPRENVRSLELCRTVLARGGALCIFPEGVSHSDLRMRKFHTGPARIALDFVRRDGNPGRLRIVPMGLLYTGKDRFRSDLWLRFGAPFDVEEWTERNPDADAEALTQEVRRRIESLVVSFESRREMVILHHAAEIVASQGRMPRPLGSEEPTSAWFALLARLQGGYRALMAEHRDETMALAERVRGYHAELKRHGLEAEEVYLPLQAPRALLFLVRELELIVVGAPLAAFGIVTHAAPYLLVRTVARALSSDKDHWASNVIYPALVVFPVYYLLLLGAAWFVLPPLGAAVVSLALPYTGYYALLYQDRTAGAWRRARTFLYLLFNRSVQSRLAAEGNALLAAIRALGGRLDAGAVDSAGARS